MKDSHLYEDRGCPLFPRCTECPFPLIDGECLYYAQGLVQSELRKAEARQLTKQGKSVAEIAEKLGMSKRQVKRYLDMAVLTEP